MFKGTKTLAKVLALALVLCMLPMAAFADAPTAKTVTITTDPADAAAAYQNGDAIEIAGTTTSDTVTILAVRSLSAAEDTELVSGSEIWEKVVFAGQKAVTDGTFSFKFFPKAGVVGSTLTVFVGGEGVSELDSIDFEVAEPAPRFSVDWVIGEDLTLTLSRVIDGAAITWFSKVDEFKLNDVDVKADASLVDNQFVFTADYLTSKGIEALSSIYVSTIDGEYSTINMTGLAFPTLKPAGTITATYPAEKDYFIAGANVPVAVANADATYGAAWLAALSANDADVEFNGADATYTYADGTLTVNTTFAEDFEEGSYAVTIKVSEYEDVTSEAIAFKASAPLDAPAVTAPVEAFANAYMPGAPTNDADLYGKYAVELLAAGANGSAIVWEVSIDDAAFVSVAAGTYYLVRPAIDGADSAKYIFRAAVKGVGKDVEVGPFPAIEVNKYGMPVHGHGAPSITDAVITPAPVDNNVVAGVALTATTEGWYDNKGYAEATTFTWAVEGGITYTGATFTPEVADIGKTLTLTAVPTVVEEEPFTGTPVVKTLTIVLDPSYEPTLAVAISGKVTAGSTAKATATYDLTYEANAEYETAYTWYLVPAESVSADEDKLAAAIALVEAGDGAVVEVADGAYDKNSAKDYAVVKGVATYTIAGQVHGTQPEAYAAALIGAKSSGGGGGAFLPGAEKPAEPKPEEPTEPTEPTEPSESEDPVSGDPVANGAAAFTDVNKETYAWAYDGIDALAKAGVFKGMTPTTFGPELTTTNAQVIALAVRIAGLKANDGATTDLVADDHWVYAEMTAAEAAGILGVFGGSVAVEEATTREVAFALLYNALKAAGVELSETAEAIEYTDASSIDAACVEAITALTKAGIVNGMGDGTLAPKATITRAQLAKILGIAQTLIK